MKKLTPLVMIVMAGCQREPKLVIVANQAQASQEFASDTRPEISPSQPDGAQRQEAERIQKASDDALATWHSGQATAEQKVEAVNRLLRPGASKREVEALLGRGVWTRRHGVHYEFFTNSGVLEGTPAGNFQEVTLDYPLPGGCMSVFFDGSSGEGRFVRAVFRKSLATQQDAPQPRK